MVELQYSRIMERSVPKDKESILDQIVFGVLSMASNYSDMVKDDEVLGKNVLGIDALVDKEMASAYHKLDANSFGGEAAPAYMKLDTLIMGGCPVAMMLPNEHADKSLKEELGAENLEYVPIAFLDLHKTGDGKFTASGLGVSKQYQGKGLSKYMVYGGAKLTGMKELVIPTQISNSAAHFAWMHLAPLDVIAVDVHHEEKDTIIYRVNIPEDKKDILSKINKEYDTYSGKIQTVPFSDVKQVLNGGNTQVLGYLPNRGLVVSFSNYEQIKAA